MLDRDHWRGRGIIAVGSRLHYLQREKLIKGEHRDVVAVI
jgi:phage gp46-like protein